MKSILESTWWRKLTSHPRPAALFVFVSVLLGLTLQEVVPQYHVKHLRRRGAPWQDDPSFLIGDCPYYRAALLSMVEDGDLDIKNNIHPRQYPASSKVALGVRGSWYPVPSVLMPFAAIPFYLVAQDRGLIAFNLAQLSLLILLIWYGARRYTSTGWATALAFWYAFGTMLRLAAYNFAPDVFSTLLVTAGIVAALCDRRSLAGLLLGLSVWAKWTNCVFLPLPVLAFALKDLGHLGRRGAAMQLLRYAAAAAIPVVALLAMNQHMFGSPFITPYDRVLIEVDGQMVLQDSHRAFFTVPFTSGIAAQLTDRGNGLLVACPPIVLAPLGILLLLWRRARADVILITGACAAQICMFAKYELWSSSSYGPRFHLSVVSLSALLVAPVLQWVSTCHPGPRVEPQPRDGA